MNQIHPRDAVSLMVTVGAGLVAAIALLIRSGHEAPRLFPDLDGDGVGDTTTTTAVREAEAATEIKLFVPKSLPGGLPLIGIEGQPADVTGIAQAWMGFQDPELGPTGPYLLFAQAKVDEFQPPPDARPIEINATARLYEIPGEGGFGRSTYVLRTGNRTLYFDMYQVPNFGQPEFATWVREMLK